MRTYSRDLNTKLCVLLSALSGIGLVVPDALAGKPDDVMIFQFTLEEICIGGSPGTLTRDGDITKPTNLGFAHVAGTMTFDARNSKVWETSEAVFQFQPGFDSSRPEGTPQGSYPFQVYKVTGSGSFYLKDDLTFAIRDHTVTSVGQNVPNTTVITGNVLRGHWATDRQSFVGESLGLTPSFGTGSDGGHFERLCAKTIHGVRTTASADPRPF